MHAQRDPRGRQAHTSQRPSAKTDQNQTAAVQAPAQHRKVSGQTGQAARHPTRY